MSESYFPESKHAHKWLDNLAKNGNGLEIGQSAHNSFNILNCINVDYTDSMDTGFKKEEVKLCGHAAKVDVVAFAHILPFNYSAFDFLINSHVFEHQCDPIGTLKEWHRVVRNNGIIYSIIPNRSADKIDAGLPITTLGHQVFDYLHGSTYEDHVIPPGQCKHAHYHIYTFKSYLQLIELFNEMFGYPMFQIVDVEVIDSKVGNGFTIVHRVLK